MYDLTELTALAADYPARAVSLSGQTIVLLLAAMANMEHRGQWTNQDLPLTDAEEDERDSIVSEALYEVMFGEVILPGEIKAWSGATLPDGYLNCDGSVVLQSSYPALFAAIGTTWNTGGEPANAFRLPDLRGRALIGSGSGSGLTNRVLGASGGSETHTLTTAELPEHTHGIRMQGGAGSATPRIAEIVTSGPFHDNESQPAGENDPHNNMQPFAVITWIIATGNIS